MDKQYKNLMDQQNISPEVTAQFCDKLEQTATRRKSVRWKAVLACGPDALSYRSLSILSLIPPGADFPLPIFLSKFFNFFQIPSLQTASPVV